MSLDIEKLRDAVAGWCGTFISDEDSIRYERDDCRAETCDCSVGECGYVIATGLDDHVAESLAVLLNGPRLLLTATATPHSDESKEMSK